MLDADAEDDGMNDQQEDPRAFVKGALLYFLMHQNPKIEEILSPFVGPGTDLAPFVCVSATEDRGDAEDYMSMDEIGYDRTMLSNKLAMTVHWQKFSPFLIRTSYGRVESQHSNMLKIRSDQLETVLEQMDNNQIDVLLEMVFGTVADEPWRESLFVEEREHAEREQRAFQVIQAQLVLNMIKINACLKGDISADIEIQKNPASNFHMALGIVHKQTHQPLPNIATIDSPESIGCELGGQIRWFHSTYWDKTMPEELLQQRWRIASINPELLLEAASLLQPSSRRFLGHKLAKSAETRGLKSIAMARAANPHFNESGIYTRMLRRSLNEAYKQIVETTV